MLKVDPLEALWVLTLMFEPSEVAQRFPTLDLVMRCWWFLVIGDFYSDSVVTLGEMVRYASEADLCYFEKCEQSNWSHFLLHHHSTKKYFFLFSFQNCNYDCNFLLEIIFCSCLWEIKCLWDILKCISDYYYVSCRHAALHAYIMVKLWTNIPTWCAMITPWIAITSFFVDSVSPTVMCQITVSQPSWSPCKFPRRWALRPPCPEKLLCPPWYLRPP